MKKILLIIGIVCVAAMAQAQSAWVTQKITGRVSAKFPSAPKVTPQGYFVSAEKDSSVLYVGFSLEAQAMQTDSATLVMDAPKPEFADQFKTGMQSTMQNVTLGNVTIGKWHGYTCYNVFGTDAKKQRYDVFVIFTGDRMYGFLANTKNPAVLTGKDKFFGSVTIDHDSK